MLRQRVEDDGLGGFRLTEREQATCERAFVRREEGGCGAGGLHGGNANGFLRNAQFRNLTFREKLLRYITLKNHSPQREDTS